MSSKFLKSVGLAIALCFASASSTAMAQTTGSIAKPKSTFTTEEIVTKGHQFFGKASRGISEAVEYLFQSQGEPTAYIVGEEGSGAVIGGLLAATLTTLFIVPAVFALLQGRVRQRSASLDPDDPESEHFTGENETP